MVVGGRGEEFMRKRLEKDEILIGEWGPFPPKERERGGFWPFSFSFQ